MWLNLQIFGFRALWSPYFLIFLILIVVAYALITGPYRHRFGGEDKPSLKQQISFYIAILLIYAVKGSPVDLMSHITLTAHMTQMAIYILIVPILIIKGIPEWIWHKFIYAPFIRPMLKVLANPIISVLLFYSLFSFYHVPFVFDFSKSSPIAHTLIHLVLFIAAFNMWLPVLAPVMELDRLKPLLKIAYVFVSAVLMTPACVIIIFAAEPLYASYSSGGAWITALSLCVPGDVLQGISSNLTGPGLFTSMDVLEDQQLGGIVMKVIQEITYGFILAGIFFKWFSKESLRVDPLPSDS
ncbi:cytochrome c oxidase assembly factor CtaG [Oceanobacillus chungangensis]|uniref:Cytochrome c oxidase assembly factor CtaG n=1 Tax=Oceanobacillus chungangensis TaxID=1229152 RepID=A0A3D8PPB0_9BACI|nr:cytochrome c oxidase assembly factor CtaG [Oceanobacillus chungangensis]RDW17950.1 cytochrome c oxidase assembly factor CtaG [Oceanobacillus chungangensis]